MGSVGVRQGPGGSAGVRWGPRTGAYQSKHRSSGHLQMARSHVSPGREGHPVESSVIVEGVGGGTLVASRGSSSVPDTLPGTFCDLLSLS